MKITEELNYDKQSDEQKYSKDYYTVEESLELIRCLRGEFSEESSTRETGLIISCRRKDYETVLKMLDRDHIKKVIDQSYSVNIFGITKDYTALDWINLWLHFAIEDIVLKVIDRNDYLNLVLIRNTIKDIMFKKKKERLSTLESERLLKDKLNEIPDKVVLVDEVGEIEKKDKTVLVEKKRGRPKIKSEEDKKELKKKYNRTYNEKKKKKDNYYKYMDDGLLSKNPYLKDEPEHKEEIKVKSKKTKKEKK